MLRISDFTPAPDMPTFAYLAIDDLGRKHRGEQDAASESALEAWLKQQGQWLAESVVVGGAPTGTGNRKVPSRVLIEFFLQLGIQLKEGIPILSALSFGAQEGTHAGEEFTFPERLAEWAFAVAASVAAACMAFVVEFFCVEFFLAKFTVAEGFAFCIANRLG